MTLTPKVQLLKKLQYIDFFFYPNKKVKVRDNSQHTQNNELVLQKKTMASKQKTMFAIDCLLTTLSDWLLQGKESFVYIQEDNNLKNEIKMIEQTNKL